MSRLQDLVGVMARALADHPEAVAVTEAEHQGRVVLEVFMAPGDLGRVIGRQGRTAAALRVLLASAAEPDGKETMLEFREARSSP